MLLVPPESLLHAVPLLVGLAIPGTVIGVSSLLFSRRGSDRSVQKRQTVRSAVGEMEIRTARAIAEANPDTAALMALPGDKSLLFNQTRNSFLMVASTRFSLLSHGGVFGPESEKVDLLEQFLQNANNQGKAALVSMVRKQDAELYRTHGFQLHKMGDEAVLQLNNNLMQGSSFRNLRNTMRRLIKASCRFEVLNPREEKLPMEELKRISEAWLRVHHNPELHFSLGRFSEEYLSRNPVAIIRCEGQAVAFANILELPARGCFTLDLLRHDPSAQNGVIDFLVGSLMLWGQSKGYHRFNLGLSPLRGITEEQWGWYGMGGRLLYHYGEHFYPFRGMYRFKRKFKPHWEPRYLAVEPGLRGLVSTLDYLMLLRSPKS